MMYRTHDSHWPLSSATQRFLGNVEVAARTALSGFLAAGYHVYEPQRLVVLLVAVAVLCVGANFGQTSILSFYAVISGVIGAIVSALPWVVWEASPDQYELRVFLTLIPFVAIVFCVGTLRLHSVARKIGLATLVVAVVPPLTDPPTPFSLDALVDLPKAIAIGAACALVAVIIPFPRSAALQADAKLHGATVGLVLLFEATVTSFTAAKDAGQPGTLWRRNMQRVQSAVREELGSLPTLCTAAKWQPQWRYRARGAWRSKQHAMLLELQKIYDVLKSAFEALAETGAFGRSHEPAPPVLVLRELATEMQALVEAARNYSRVCAGTQCRPDTSELGRAFASALRDFDESARNARTVLVYGGTSSRSQSSRRAGSSRHASSIRHAQDRAYAANGNGDGNGNGNGNGIGNGKGGGVAGASKGGNANCVGGGGGGGAQAGSTDSLMTFKPEALDRKWREEAVLAYSLLFWSMRFVEALQDISTPPPPKRRSIAQRICSAVRCSAADVWAALLLPVGGGNWPTRLKDGARLSVAMTVAAILSLRFDRAIWGPVTAGFVWEPGLGSTIRTSGLRLQGSVLGCFYGYSVYAIGQLVPAGTKRNFLVMSLFSLWVGLCSFVRVASKRNGYAGFVAAFTAIIVLTPSCGGLSAAPDCVDEDSNELGVTYIVLARIQMTLIGILAVLLTSLFVFRQSNSTLIYNYLATVVTCTRTIYAQIHTDYVVRTAADPNADCDCCDDAPNDAKAADDAPAMKDEGANVAKGGRVALTSRATRAQRHISFAETDSVSPPSKSDPASGARTSSRLSRASAVATAVSSATSKIVLPAASAVKRAISFNEPNGDTNTKEREHELSSADSTAEQRGSSSRAALLDAAETEIGAATSSLRATLAQIDFVVSEAQDMPDCPRPFPAEGVTAVVTTLRAMLLSLTSLHTAIGHFQPGCGAVLLLRPLMSPLNMLETHVTIGLQGLLHKLLGGDLRWLERITAGMPRDSHTTTSISTAPRRRRTLGQLTQAQQQFEESYEAVLSQIVQTDRRFIRDEGGDTPSLSNTDVLAFNAVTFSIRTFVKHIVALDQRIEDLLVVSQPIDLNSIKYV